MMERLQSMDEDESAYRDGVEGSGQDLASSLTCYWKEWE